MKVVEVDQWLSQDISSRFVGSLDQLIVCLKNGFNLGFELSEETNTVHEITGTKDFKVLDVAEHQSPSFGHCWFFESPTGAKLYKTNYDSTG
jgi:hypothetical protein